MWMCCAILTGGLVSNSLNWTVLDKFGQGWAPAASFAVRRGITGFGST